METGTLDAVARMSAIMGEAETLIVKGDASSLERLRPLRLRMAGAVTTFQAALGGEHAALVRAADPRASDLRRCVSEWAKLGDEFRSFAARNQAPIPPSWDEYRPQARAFMRRFRDQIASVRALLEAGC